MTRPATILILTSALALSVSANIGAPSALRAQSAAPQSAASAPSGAPAPTALDLRPKFIPGQTLRYQMELTTKTEGSSTGIVQDPQGPSQLIVTWDATVRIDVLPPEVLAPTSQSPATPAKSSASQSSASPAALRLRMTYEKSAATLQSDGYDPTASAIQDQYARLQGHAVEFALDARGKVTIASGGDDVFTTPQAARDAQAWVAQLSAGIGAPTATVTLGQQWISEQPAAGIPLPGMTWRTNSSYERNDPCPQSPIRTPSIQSGASPATETCAVILTRVTLVPPKSEQKAEADANKKSAAQSGASVNPSDPSATTVPKGMQSTGTWTGSSESLIYVSLRTGWAVSVTQSGDEKMDVTLVSEHLDSIRYAGTIQTHVDLHLLP